MNQRAAFDETVELAIREGMPEMSAVSDSLGLAHLRSMQKRIAEGEFSDAKLGRWLGWAQAALVAANIGVSLEDMKQINLRHADDEKVSTEAAIHEYLHGGEFKFAEGQAVKVIAPGEEHERGVVLRRVHRPGGGEEVYWLLMSHGSEWRYFDYELEADTTAPEVNQ